MLNRNRQLPAGPSAADFLTRRGAALIEGAIVLSVTLLLLLTLLDVALAVQQQAALTEAARLLARECATHGAAAPPQQTAWGPNSYSGNAADGTEMAGIVREVVVIGDPQDVIISITWPDGSHDLDDRVRVSLALTRQPLAGWGALTGPYQLTSTCESRIQH